MNWKFWQRKPKTDDFGPVIAWYTPKPEDEVSAEEFVKPLLSDPEPEPEPVIIGDTQPPDPNRMNPEIKARWVAALRSGDYKQGKGLLRSRDDHKKSKFCCLGVLCELAVQDGVIKPGTRDPMWGIYSYDGAMKVPSANVANWAGLNSYNPDVTVAGRRFSLASLNDEQGKDFNQIADLIEAQL